MLLRFAQARLGKLPTQLAFEQIDAPMIAAMLAVLKLGYSYIPLDPQQAINSLTQKITDTGAALIISDEHYQEIANKLSLTIPC